MFVCVDLGKLTWNPKSWRFGSDDLPFQGWVIFSFKMLISGGVKKKIPECPTKDESLLVAIFTSTFSFLDRGLFGNLSGATN